jgi:aminoglycoside phosphotransferase (APT) family kinase protein
MAVTATEEYRTLILVESSCFFCNAMEEIHIDLLKACVNKCLPYINQPIKFTPVPTGRFNTSFFVNVGDQQFVLRIAPASDNGLLFYEHEMMHQEPGLHHLLIEKTSVPVPQIKAYDFSHTILDQDFILMERLPGRTLWEMRHIDISRCFLQLGKCLAEVHAITANRYGYLGEHLPMEPQDNWVDAFRIIWNLLLEDVWSTGYYDSYEIKFMKALLDRYLRLFDRPIKASLLHMDIWAQNILVDGRDLSGLLDWQTALWGDPEMEFAILDYHGISRPVLWEGYGNKREQSLEAQTRRIFYLLFENLRHIVIYHFRRNNPQTAFSFKQKAIQLIRDLH